MEYKQRSTPLAITSMVLGGLSLMTWCFFYISIPAGAVAIILAVLSRGGYDKFDAKARVGFILGIVGLVISVCLVVGTVLFIHSFGTFDNFMHSYANMTGMSYDDIYDMMKKMFETYGFDFSDVENMTL